MKKFITAVSVMAMTVLVLTACVGGPAAPTKSPEELIKEAFTNSMEIKSHSFEATVDVDMTADGETLSGSATLSGEQDMNDLEDPKFVMEFGFEGSFGDFPEQSGSAEMMLDGNTIYFVLNSITDFDGNIPAEMVAPFVGQWYFMPLPEDATAQFGVATDPEQLEIAKQMFLEHFFLSDVEYVGGQGSDYHYTAELDKKAFAAYMKASTEMSGQMLTVDDMGELEAALESVDASFDIYIDADEVLLSGWDGSVVLDIEGEGGTIDFEIDTSDFDKSVKIDAPDGAVEFNPMMLLGPAMMMQPGMSDIEMDTTGMEMSDAEMELMMEEMELMEEELMMEVEEVPEGGVLR